jgi:hypothetical protein
MGSGKMYGFWRNVWVPEKCNGSGGVYRCWRDVEILKKCGDAENN